MEEYVSEKILVRAISSGTSGSLRSPDAAFLGRGRPAILAAPRQARSAKNESLSDTAGEEVPPSVAARVKRKYD